MRGRNSERLHLCGWRERKGASECVIVCRLAGCCHQFTPASKGQLAPCSWSFALMQNHTTRTWRMCELDIRSSLLTPLGWDTNRTTPSFWTRLGIHAVTMELIDVSGEISIMTWFAYPDGLATWDPALHHHIPSFGVQTQYHNTAYAAIQVHGSYLSNVSCSWHLMAEIGVLGCRDFLKVMLVGHVWFGVQKTSEGSHLSFS